MFDDEKSDLQKSMEPIIKDQGIPIRKKKRHNMESGKKFFACRFARDSARVFFLLLPKKER
jgi:hypothetical protein